MAIPHASKISPSVRSVVRADGAVLMDTNSGLMFSVNHVGGFIWEQLGTGAGHQQIVELIAQQYDITSAEAQRDVNEFIAELERRHLLTGT